MSIGGTGGHGSSSIRDYYRDLQGGSGVAGFGGASSIGTRSAGSTLAAMPMFGMGPPPPPDGTSGTSATRTGST